LVRLFPGPAFSRYNYYFVVRRFQFCVRSSSPLPLYFSAETAAESSPPAVGSAHTSCRHRGDIVGC